MFYLAKTFDNKIQRQNNQFLEVKNDVESNYSDYFRPQRMVWLIIDRTHPFFEELELDLVDARAKV